MRTKDHNQMFSQLRFASLRVLLRRLSFRRPLHHLFRLRCSLSKVVLELFSTVLHARDRPANVVIRNSVRKTVAVRYDYKQGSASTYFRSIWL